MSTWTRAVESWNHPAENACSPCEVPALGSFGVEAGSEGSVSSICAVVVEVSAGNVAADDVDVLLSLGAGAVVLSSVGSSVTVSVGSTRSDSISLSSAETMSRCAADHFGWHVVSVSVAMFGSVVETTP